MRETSFACPGSHSKVKGDKDHFPIYDESHGRNALSRIEQYDAAPTWWSGTLEELKNTISRAVHSRYPNIGKNGD